MSAVPSSPAPARSTVDHRPVADAVPRSVGRVLDLLEVVLADRETNLTGAAIATGLTPTTALRHLRALEARGYVDRDDDGQFRVGPTMLRLAATLRHAGPLDGLIATAQPELDALAVTTGESCYLAVSDGQVATYVAAAESSRAIRHVGWVGQNVPLEGTAVGAALETPGACVTRIGAVEPDITAISLALRPIGELGVAMSVIGPSHRFDAPRTASHSAALTHAVAGVLRFVGTTSEPRDQEDTR